MFAAILDTSVLWPSLQRDFLLSLAVEGIYRPLWSEAILQELQTQETLKLTKRGALAEDAGASADHLVAEMKTHFSDALVTGWEPLEGTYGLRDPDDEHVVAAAVIGGAGAIVTANIKDFDAVPAEIQVQPPRGIRPRPSDRRPDPGCPSHHRDLQTTHQITEHAGRDPQPSRQPL